MDAIAAKAEHDVAMFVRGHDPKTGRWRKGVRTHIGTDRAEPPRPGARNSGQFRRGESPANAFPVGHTRIDPATGEVMVRTDSAARYYREDETQKASNYFRPRRVLVWEAHHGPVPEGHVVIRLDDDPTLDEAGNLMCIPRAVLVRLNQTSPLRTLPPYREHRRAAVLEAQIHQRSHDLGHGFRRARAALEPHHAE